MSERPAMRYGKKGPNHKRHWRVELGTAVTLGKRRTNLQDPPDDTGAGILKESTRDVHWVATNEGLDTVEGPTSSEAEKRAAPVCPQLQMTRDIKNDYKSYHGVARDEHTSRRGR
jgi:hypothetical protein